MPSNKPSLSLVVATVDRMDPLHRLLTSLTLQTVKDFEVLLVDQNQGDELAGVVATYADQLPLRWVRSARGLSRARNIGLQHIRGGIVGFPDDDCWYDENVVDRCLHWFAHNPGADGYTGVCRDAQGRASAGRFDAQSGPIERHNVWRRANSTTLFCRASVAVAIGGFDETLGLGSGTRWGSGEETDFVLRALQHGSRFEFDPDFVIRHPQTGITTWADAKRRALPYARGYQRVLVKHGYSFRYSLISVLRPLAGAVLHLARGRLPASALSFWTAMGRLDEWSRARDDR